MGAKTNLKVEKGKKTAQHILAEARWLFAQKGYAHTTAGEIAEHARVTRGALYHHFNNKKGVFLAVFKAIHQEILMQVKVRVEAEPDLFKRQIVGNDAFLEAASKPGIRQILLIDAPVVLGWDLWRQIDEENVMGSYKEYLRMLSAQGLIKPYPINALAHIISGAANEGVFYISEAKNPKKALKEVQETMAALIESLRP